jgi:hypothetical protein
VSHLEEREEKVCLNCNAQLNGRYCHICGQENLEPKESFWHLLTHFVYDVTHFDGKFFSTLKYLVFRPGFLATEYLAGKRASYLHPIRMYVFASAIFFVVFFSFIVKPEEVGDKVVHNGKHGFSELKQAIKDSLSSVHDSDTRAGLTEALAAMNKISAEKESGKVTVKDSTYQAKPGKTGEGYHYIPKQPLLVKDTLAGHAQPAKKDSVKKAGDEDDDDKASDWHVNVKDGQEAETAAEYDSAQQKLPPNKRDGWFTRMLNHRMLDIKHKYHGDRKEMVKVLLEKFLHAIPQMMFVSVPFVALVLQLLYIRRRKTYFYVNHVIFIIYVYIATFVSLLVSFGLSALYDATKFAPFSWLHIIVIIYIFLYCWLAMHNFYRQGYVKSFFKYFILLFICSFVAAIIMSFFVFTSIMSI